jgi:hypothetical protein
MVEPRARRFFLLLALSFFSFRFARLITGRFGFSFPLPRGHTVQALSGAFLRRNPAQAPDPRPDRTGNTA